MTNKNPRLTIKQGDRVISQTTYFEFYDAENHCYRPVSEQRVVADIEYNEKGEPLYCILARSVEGALLKKYIPYETWAKIRAVTTDAHLERVRVEGSRLLTPMRVFIFFVVSFIAVMLIYGGIAFWTYVIH